MRIAAVCPYSLSVPGGVQDQVLGLASELRLLGHEVDVIAPCDGDALPHTIGVGRSVAFRVNGSTAAMAPTPTAAARTVRALRSGRYDVLHVHEPLAPSITIPALLSRAAPVVGTFHAGGDRTPYRWFGPPLRLLSRLVDEHVAVSTEAARLAKRHLGHDCEVLFNGIDPATYATVEPTVVTKPMILFLGRHEPRKGLDVLLRAMTTLPDDIELWIAGDGPERAGLQARFPNDHRIRWLGRISEVEKIGHLRAASVVCVPSLHGESFGLVLLEAMAAGTPVVATDLPGYRALVSEEAGLLVPPAHPHALAGALRRVLRESPPTAAFRANGPARVRQFSLCDLALQYVGIYERAISGVAALRVRGRLTTYNSRG